MRYWFIVFQRDGSRGPPIVGNCVRCDEHPMDWLLRHKQPRPEYDRSSYSILFYAEITEDQFKEMSEVL